MTHVRAAVVDEEGGDWSIGAVELADPVEDELLVRVVACGVCHTDIAARDGTCRSRCPCPRFSATRAPAWSRRSGRS